MVDCHRITYLLLAYQCVFLMQFFAMTAFILRVLFLIPAGGYGCEYGCKCAEVGVRECVVVVAGVGSRVREWVRVGVCAWIVMFQKGDFRLWMSIYGQ